MPFLKRLFGGKPQPAPVPPELFGLKRLYRRLVENMPENLRDIYTLSNNEREHLGDLLDAIAVECEAISKRSKGYELGGKTRLEVQDAEQNVNQARANLAVAQRDYRLARVNLDWVAGVLDGGAPPAPVK